MATVFEPRPSRRDSLAALERTPSARSLLDVFADTVSRHGDRIAVDADTASLTYAQLADAAGELAASLSELGVGAGDRVGVRVPSGTSDLYVAILGVLMAGAAYVPVDADDPPARATSIWRSAGVCAIVGEGLAVTRLALSASRAREVTPEDDAWVIFTSGSTGEPKGVAVSHRAAAAFVDAEARLWTVYPEDRVLAGLSVGFDASCEEIWLAWRNGAALVPARREIVRSGAEFGAWIAASDVTVISTVPTLASLWDESALAGVRLMIVGGEACPRELAWRLAAEREVWNTYGPTEATVVSTASRLRPNSPVTIGWPLAGWQVAVVDAAGEPVPFGEPGELVIGGVGLGRYLDPALDAERFAPLESLGWPRAYRSGDIVRETTAGLDFVGRRDDQVKLGGRRLELGEIDAQLCAAPGVRAGVAAVRESEAGNKLLVGYIVGDAEPATVRAHVAQTLPAGIVPLIVTLDSLPQANSGKIDRKALPWPPPSPLAGSEGLTGTAAWLAERWSEQLGPLPVAADSDFFELGGSSVAAAKLVSAVRARFPTAAIADVYKHRRLDELADRLDELGSARDETAAAPRSGARVWSALQALGVVALIGFAAPSWLIGIFGFDAWQGTGPTIAWPALVLSWLLFVSSPGRALIIIAARRALMRGVVPGRYPRRSWLGLRIWFLERLAERLHVARLAGTPWAARMARLTGHPVGEKASLATLPSPTALVRIGAGATVEPDVDFHGWWIEGSELVIGELLIGANARIGSRSVLMPGAEIGDNAEIEPGTVVNGPVPAGERWAGSPARRVGRSGDEWPVEGPAPARESRASKACFSFALMALSVVPLIAALPSLYAFTLFDGGSQSIVHVALLLIVSSPLLAAGFVISEALMIALMVRGLARWIRPGWYGDDGFTACALWLQGQFKQISQGALFPLYMSLYTRPWLRLMGISVGKRTEVSIVDGLNRLVSLGETSFVADAPMFATGRARNGWLHLAPIEIGSRTFVGNGSLMAPGTKLGDDCLLGIETNAPAHAADGTSWFGSPPIELPRVPDRADPARTTNPPRRLVLARGATELVRILLPNALTIVIGAGELLALEAAGHAGGALAMIAVAPLALFAGALFATALTVALKWLLIGRYKRRNYTFWSFFVWRDEIINSAQELLAGQWLLNAALGSPLMRPYLRAMGARVGKDVWCETLAITEFDLVTVGDGCAINRGACLETHLVHDRLLRLGPATLHDGSTLGPHSATLPDSELGAGCSVGGRSVVMRGEALPAHTRWHGAPVVGA